MESVMRRIRVVLAVIEVYVFFLIVNSTLANDRLGTAVEPNTNSGPTLERLEATSGRGQDTIDESKTQFAFAMHSDLSCDTFSGTFCDDFEDGDAIGWTPYANGSWSVDNGSYVFTSDSLWGTSLAGDPNWTNYTFEVDVMGVSGSNKTLWVRVRDFDPRTVPPYSGDFYCIVLNVPYDLIVFLKYEQPHKLAIDYNNKNRPNHTQIVLNNQ